MLFQDRNKESGYFLIGFLLNILMVEPDAFFIIKFSARPATMTQIEQFDQLIH